QVIEQALQIRRLMHVPAVLAETEPADDRSDAIVGRCAAMQAVYKAIGRVAPPDVTVLITGESGTGKDLVGRAVYQPRPPGRPAPSSPSTAPPSPSNSSKANSSDTKKALTPERSASASASLSSVRAARSSLMRSATCRP